MPAYLYDIHRANMKVKFPHMIMTHWYDNRPDMSNETSAHDSIQMDSINTNYIIGFCVHYMPLSVKMWAISAMPMHVAIRIHTERETSTHLIEPLIFASKKV